MPYPNFHAARVRDPGDFVRIRVLQTLPNGVMIYGGPLKTDPRGSGKPQAYRFPKSKFTVSEAKAWLRKNKIKYILFEPASGKQSLSDLTDIEVMQYFKSIQPNDLNLAKVFFREILGNRHETIHFEKNLEPGFLSIAQEVLPELIWNTVKAKNAIEILTGAADTMKSFDRLPVNAPVLIREPKKTEAVGMVRFDSMKMLRDNGKGKVKEYEYHVMDYIPFFALQKSKNALYKLNDEKKQMFSVVYRSWESWKQPDTDNEYVEAEELRKAVIGVALNGIGLNIQHDDQKEISQDDAAVIEFYQARTGWHEDGLEVRKGDVVATTQFFDTKIGDELWNDLKSNEFTTYSMEGRWYPEEVD